MYANGAPERVMIDVVVLRGSGREIIPVPEMEAFADASDSVSLRMRIATPTVRRA